MEQWATLTFRLSSFLEVHERFARLPSNAVNGSQEKALLASAVALARDFLSFRSTLATSWPDGSLQDFDDARLRELAEGALDQSVATMRAANTAELALRLSLLRNDLDVVLGDGQEAIRSRTERAILHLQWSIQTTEPVRKAWIDAFEKDEAACEALGATHLLAHGIFAFKATSSAARTDLVFHEPVNTDVAYAVAEGLVLTEWKRLTDPRKLNASIDSADVQADLYGTGVLGGSELRRIRYVVVVSKEQVHMPEDTIRQGYLIRHLNIAVHPDAPSVAAPKLARAARPVRTRKAPAAA
jgi:hypothetical protein